MVDKAVSTPSSERILSPTRAAFSIMFLSVVALRSPSAMSSAEVDETLCPTPNFVTRMALLDEQGSGVVHSPEELITEPGLDQGGYASTETCADSSSAAVM